MGSLGEKLRKNREQRGLELEAISNATKISVRMLRALEEEQFDQLPGGVFNKGFVRAYARLVGLNEEQALTDYLDALRESQVQQQAFQPDFRTPANKLAPVKPIPTVAPPSPLGASDSVAAAPVANKEITNQAVTEKAAPENVLSNNNPSNSNAAEITRTIPDLHPPDPGKTGDSPLLYDRRVTDRRVQHDRRKPGQRYEDPRVHEESVPATDSTERAAVPERRAKYPDGNIAQPANKTSGVPWMTLAAALLIIVLALALWNRRHGQPALATQPSSTATMREAQPEISNAVPVATDATISSAPARPTDSAPAATIKSSPTPTPRTSPPASTAHPTAAQPISTQPSSTQPSIKPTAKPGTRAAAPKPLPIFSLLIRADKTTWVSITADGKPVAEETLIAPAHTSVRATREIVVKAGNAAGISFVLNGKEIPVHGGAGEVQTYVFNGTTMKVLPATQASTPIN